jgi:SEC-C motif
MRTENPESPDSRSSPPEHEAHRQREAEPAHQENHIPPDAPALVAQMVAAGRWPAPDLLAQIVSVGDAAVEPLRAILRSNPRGWPAQATLVHAIRLVSTLRPSAAIPELVSIVRRYLNKPEEEAAEALVRFGPSGFETLLDLCRDPSMHGYRRVDVAWAAKTAAGDDPVLKARLAEVMRSILEQLIAKARDEHQLRKALELADDDDEVDGEEPNDLLDKDAHDEEAEYDEDQIGVEDEDLEEDENWDEEDDPKEDADWANEDSLEDEDNWGEDVDFDEETDDLAPDVSIELAFVVSDISDLADPLAVDLIKTAFDQELIDCSFIDQEEVDEQYRHGGTAPKAKGDWLEFYRNSYDRHAEAVDSSSSPPPPIDVRRPRYRYEDRYDEGEPPPDIPATAPILNASPRLGRNDPCWCGSGKKYKRCHWGKETQE